MTFIYKLLRQGQNRSRRLRIQRRSVLVEKKQLRLFHHCHKQRESLPLTAGEQADFRRKPLFQSQLQLFQHLSELLSLFRRNSPSQPSELTSSAGERHVLFYPHISGRSHHRILEHAAKIFRPLMLREARHIYSVYFYRTAVHGINAGDRIQHGRFAGAVSAYYGYKVSILQHKIQIVERFFLVYSAGVESFVYILYLKHISGSFTLVLRSFALSCSSNKALPGKAQPQAQRRASDHSRSYPGAIQ